MTDENFPKATFVLGLVLGIVVTAVLWICTAEQIEKSKVNAGYLTYESKTYSVTLYDTLDAPEKKE